MALAEIFLRLEKLEILDIVQALKVVGMAFEHTPSRLQKLKISFDEYNLGVLKSILKRKELLAKMTIINIQS